MMIDANLLPFNVDELVKSKAWHNATPEQRRKFISAGVTFDTVLTHYADKYRAKKTVKGEFIACVLWDFYFDLFSNPVGQGNAFDYELDTVYQAVDEKAPIDQYSERLLDEALHPKRWIKVLKQAYRENKAKIIESATDENGNVDLDLINDAPVEYRDYMYQRKINFGVWNKMLTLEDFEPLTIEEFQQLKLNATTYQAGEIDVCRKFYDYNKDILIDPVFVRNSDYCMIVSKNDPEDTNLTYID